MLTDFVLRYRIFLVGLLKSIGCDDPRIISNPFNADYSEFLNRVWQWLKLQKSSNASLYNVISQALGRCAWHVIDDLSLEEQKINYDLASLYKYCFIMFFVFLKISFY
jgi:hypothetical protein|tara:strand:- start:272 stop:595 length:324 start_codon:yes stop_codon:yes gene_type:complete